MIEDGPRFALRKAMVRLAERTLNQRDVDRRDRQLPRLVNRSKLDHAELLSGCWHPLATYWVDAVDLDRRGQGDSLAGARDPYESRLIAEGEAKMPTRTPAPLSTRGAAKGGDHHHFPVQQATDVSL